MPTSTTKLSTYWVFIRNTEVGCNSPTECRQTPTRDSPGKFSRPWCITLMKECWVSHSVWREPFAPGGHPQTRERREISGGRSTTSKEAPTSGEEGIHRRKGNHDQRCYLAPWWVNLLSSMGCNRSWDVIILCWIIYLSSCVEYTLLLKVSYHAIKGVELQCFLGSIQYAVSIIGLVMNTFA
jgi:hypothetical protein